MRRERNRSHSVCGEFRVSRYLCNQRRQYSDYLPIRMVIHHTKSLQTKGKRRGLLMTCELLQWFLSPKAHNCLSIFPTFLYRPYFYESKRIDLERPWIPYVWIRCFAFLAENLRLDRPFLLSMVSVANKPATEVEVQTKELHEAGFQVVREQKIQNPVATKCARDLRTAAAPADTAAVNGKLARRTATRVRSPLQRGVVLI